MKKFLVLLLVLGSGVVLGRFFGGAPPRAEAGGGDAFPPCQDINGDGKSDVSDVIFFLQWRFLGGPEPSCRAENRQLTGVPETGQASCYDANGAQVSCDDAACPGQDASYRTGCPWEARFADNEDGTVTDT